MNNIYQKLISFQAFRRTPALFYCSAEQSGKNLAASDIRVFAQCLRTIGKTDQIDLILNTEGGLVSTAYRMATLIHEFAEKVNIFVPGRARSAGTVVCLGATELIMGTLGELGPIDPLLRQAVGSTPRASDLSAEDVRALSAEDIRAFFLVAEKWFNLTTPEHRVEIFGQLAKHFSPNSLAAFYRASEYVKKIAGELLEYQLPNSTKIKRDEIVDGLMHVYSDHKHIFTRERLKQLGLNVRAAAPREEEILEDLLTCCWEYCENTGSSLQKPRCVIMAKGFAAHYVHQAIELDKTSDGMNKKNMAIIHCNGSWVPVSI